MASPGILIEAVAQAFGVPTAKIFAAHRYLREAGRIATGGRGNSAARMTVSDAAMVMTAACGPQAKDAVSTIERPGKYHSGRRWQLPFLPVPELQALPADHTLLDALCALIEAGISGSLTQAAEAAYGGEVDLVRDTDPGLVIDVTLIDPIPRARIMIALLEDDEDESRVISKEDQEVRWYALKAPGTGRLSHIPLATYEDHQIDLRTERTFTHRSIMRVAELLRG